MSQSTSPAPSHREKCVDLVFRGGGVKGIGLVGALAVLEERGFQAQNLAGTSAGAVVATLYAAGYSASDLREIIMAFDFNRFMDRSWRDRIPGIGTPLSILKDHGIYVGQAFLEFMRDHLQTKGKKTFKDLVHPDFADDPRYRYRVQVIASDITNHRLLVLPQDAGLLGIEPDDLEVALAVRMSMSIPIFFEPVRILNHQTGQEHLIVDGGILSNFPVWLFDSNGIPEWPTFGLLLVESEPERSMAERLPRPERRRGTVGQTVDYVKSLVMTMLEAHDRMYVEKANFARTIPIATLGVSTTEFNLSKDRAVALYESGRAAAEKFLQTWNFERYIAEFRQGKEHSRLEEISEAMRRA
jgi:NTE family protein